MGITSNFLDYLSRRSKLLIQTRSDDAPWFVHEYSAGSLAKIQYGGLDDKNYSTLCLVRKRPDSTWGKIPMQGAYLADPAWRDGLAGI